MNNHKLAVILFSLLLFAGCEPEEFLTVENENNLSAGSFWRTEAEIEQGLIATYAALQLEGLMGGSAATQLPVRSDTGRPNNWNANARSLNTLAFNENTDVVQRRWQACYIGIYRANQVLANLDNVPMDEATYTLIEAQTRFLRGFFYYSLYRGYNKGSVILFKDVPGSREEFYQELALAQEVHDFLKADLEFAEANLPKEYPASELGRATWGAAAAMLGKLHINEHRYEEAKGYFKAILESGLYRLTTHIGDNFDEEHEFNSESIFEVAFSIDAKAGTAGGAQDGPTGSEATSRARTLASTPGGGWRVIMPSYWVTMLFRSDTADLSNPMNVDRVRPDGTAGYSERTSMSIAIADDIHSTLYQLSSEAGGAYNNREASYLKKFQNWTWDRESNLTVSGINERVIRLADVMLLYAETLLQTGGSVAEALDLVNTIRARSGVVLLDPAEYDADQLMEHIMWVERPLELMFEGHDIRWEDLVRWGKVKEQYERLGAMKFVQVDKVLHYYDPNNPEHEGLPLLQEFGEAATVYNPDFHDYFPIPSAELTSNPGLGPR